MRKILAAAILFVIGADADAACIPPNESEIAQIREKLALELKDSESARFRDVCKLTRTVDRPHPVITFCGLVNAKNSFGAYGGFVRFAAAIGASVDDGSPLFESTYCMACLEPERTMQACFDRTTKMIDSGELHLK